MAVSEKDWKLFRSKLPGWQEAYMEKLIQEYRELLSGPEPASERFWALHDRVKADKRHPGVIMEMRRSILYENLLRLLFEGVISLKDLEGFSEELQEVIRFIVERESEVSE